MSSLPWRRCAGAVLLHPTSSLVLAGERVRHAGAWQCPQGGVDEGESGEAAGKRELFEETGVDGEAYTQLGVLAGEYKYALPSETHLGKLFCGQVLTWVVLRAKDRLAELPVDAWTDVSGRGGEPPEFRRLCWMPMADIVAAQPPFKREMYELVARDLAAMLGE